MLEKTVHKHELRPRRILGMGCVWVIDYSVTLPFFHGKEKNQCRACGWRGQLNNEKRSTMDSNLKLIIEL